MTTEQYLVMLGTIYIVPHTNPIYCQVAGCGFLIVAGCKGLGWI